MNCEEHWLRLWFYETKVAHPSIEEVAVEDTQGNVHKSHPIDEKNQSLVDSIFKDVGGDHHSFSRFHFIGKEGTIIILDFPTHHRNFVLSADKKFITCIQRHRGQLSWHGTNEPKSVWLITRWPALSVESPSRPHAFGMRWLDYIAFEGYEYYGLAQDCLCEIKQSMSSKSIYGDPDNREELHTMVSLDPRFFRGPFCINDVHYRIPPEFEGPIDMTLRIEL